MVMENTLIIWLYKQTCGECGLEEPQDRESDDIVCRGCGTEFRFATTSDERLLPEDIRSFEEMANAIGLVVVR